MNKDQGENVERKEKRVFQVHVAEMVNLVRLAIQGPLGPLDLQAPLASVGTLLLRWLVDLMRKQAVVVLKWE